MTTWTIYQNPADAPGLFVVRAFDCQGGEAVARRHSATFRTLEAARDSLPPGLACFARDDGDDPCIVETWL